MPGKKPVVTLCCCWFCIKYKIARLDLHLISVLSRGIIKFMVMFRLREKSRVLEI